MDAGMAAGMEAGMSVARNIADKISTKNGEEIPEEEFDLDDEEPVKFKSGTFSKRREFKYCARKFATLQDRLAKMEAYVTSNQFRLHREFKSI